jgi:hypothetical protein
MSPDLCPICRQPGHATETDDLGRHPGCATAVEASRAAQTTPSFDLCPFCFAVLVGGRCATCSPSMGEHRGEGARDRRALR